MRGGFSSRECKSFIIFGRACHPNRARLLPNFVRFQSPPAAQVGERTASAASLRSQLHEIRSQIDESINRSREIARDHARSGGAGFSFLRLLSSELAANPSLSHSLGERLAGEGGRWGGGAGREAVEWCLREMDESETVRARLLRGLDALPTRPSEEEVIPLLCSP